MSLKWTAVFLIVAVPLIGGCGKPVDPATMGAQVLALKAGLSELQHTLDSLQIGTNQIATDRIHQMRVEADGLINRLDKLQQDGFKNGNDILNDVTRSTHQLSSDLRHTIKETERTVFLDLNSSLANLNNTLDGLPLVDVDAYVAAVQPMRISVNAVDRQIALYGYFPALKKGEGEVHISVLGQDIKASLGAGGKVSFNLPAADLQEQTYVNFVIEIDPASNFISQFWKKKQKLEERVYVEKEIPYSCKVTRLVTNPEWEVGVVANREFTARAATEGGAATPTNNGSRTAQELFTATVDNAAALYDTATVKIKDPRGRTWDGKPCEHITPSASFTWTPDSVSYALSAPSGGGHMHSGTRCENTLIGRVCGIPYAYLHGGGGSHANVAFNPIFTAHKLNVPQYVENEVGVFSLGRHRTLEQAVPFQENWKLRAVCSFADGAEVWDTKPIELSAQDPEETVDGVTARFSEGKLFLSTEKR